MVGDRMQKMFKKFDVDNSGALDFREFIEFMSSLRRRYANEDLSSS
jgi:Ca2+-binding EF-hand superfamily protein